MSFVVLMSVIVVAAGMNLTSSQSDALRSVLDGIGCRRNASACPQIDSPTICTDPQYSSAMRINCTGNHVGEIRLEGRMGIGGSISTLIAELTALTTLSLQMIGLNGTIPVALAALTNLKILKLGKNGLMGAMPDLSQLTALTDFQINDNSVFGTATLSLQENIGTCLLERTCLQCSSFPQKCSCDSTLSSKCLIPPSTTVMTATTTSAIVTNPATTPTGTTTLTTAPPALTVSATTTPEPVAATTESSTDESRLASSARVTSATTAASPDIVVIASAAVSVGAVSLALLTLLIVCRVRRRRRNVQHSKENRPQALQEVVANEYGDIGDVHRPAISDEYGDFSDVQRPASSRYKAGVSKNVYDAPESTLEI